MTESEQFPPALESRVDAQRDCSARVLIGETAQAGWPISAPISDGRRPTPDVRWVRRADSTYCLECWTPPTGWREVPVFIPDSIPMIDPAHAREVMRGKKPVPGTVEYDEETELGQEADDAMDRLSWPQPNNHLSDPSQD